MGRTIEIIDPEGEQRRSRHRRIAVLATLSSLALFGYPLAKEYSSKWQTLQASRSLALYLSGMKTRAIRAQKPMEAQFKQPNTVEVYEVSSCGPGASRTKIESFELSSATKEVRFVPEPWVRQYTDSRDPYLPRLCYDPMFGSSIFADGLVRGTIFVAHKRDIDAEQGDRVVQISVEGASSDLSID